MTKKEIKELEVSKKKTIEKSKGEHTREGITYTPDVNIIEDAENITLQADLPGVKRENLDIDIREDTLTLTGTLATPEKHHNLIYREYELGGFSRRFTLGERIDQEKISAKLDNGVLTLVLPKAAAHQPKKIEIT